MMRKLEIDHSPEHPRDLVITPKEEWISKHGYWSEEDAPEDDDPTSTPVHRSMGGEWLSMGRFLASRFSLFGISMTKGENVF